MAMNKKVRLVLVLLLIGSIFLMYNALKLLPKETLPGEELLTTELNCMLCSYDLLNFNHIETRGSV